MNENIKGFLTNNYLKEDITGFGILIDGNWGCGKTYLINEILKENKEQIKSYYISVYGLTTLEQLHSRVYEKIHPILTSKAVKVSSGILKGLIKGSLHIDFDKDNNEDLTIELPLDWITSDDFEKDIKLKKVIIVDDLERCSIPADQIFGFFSEYIIEKNAKVIFICNQEELKKKYIIEKTANNETTNDEYTEKYLAIKEKVIGFEFFVEPDYNEAINEFIREFKLESIKNELIDVTCEIKDLYQLKNLRTIRQAFYYIRIIYNVLKDIDHFDLNVFNEIIRYFEIIFISKTSGKLNNKNDIRKVIAEYRTNINILNQNNKKQEPLSVPLEKLYYDMIFLGKFDRDEIIKHYKLWIFPEEPSDYLQFLLNQWSKLSDNDFLKYFKKVEENFNSGKFKTYLELWNYAEFLLSLNAKGILQKSSSEIENEITKYIEKYGSKLTGCICPEELNEMLYYDENYISPLNDHNEIINAIVDSSIEKNKEFTKNNIVSIFDDLSKNYDEFLKVMNSYTCFDFESAVYSIFDFITPDQFFNQVVRLKIEQQKKIYKLFENIYVTIIKSPSVNVFNKIVAKETTIMKQIAELYEKSAQPNVLMSPEKYEKKLLAEQYLHLYQTLNSNPEKLVQ